MHSNNTQSNCKQEHIYKIKVTTQALEAHQVKQQITSTGWPLVFVSVVPSVCPVSLFLRFKPAHIENSPGTCSCAENRLLVSIRWETSHALLLTKAYVDRERRISDYEQIYRIRGPGATRVTDSEISNLQVAVIPAYVLGHECCRAIPVLSDQSFINYFLSQKDRDCGYRIPARRAFQSNTTSSHRGKCFHFSWPVTLCVIPGLSSYTLYSTIVDTEHFDLFRSTKYRFRVLYVVSPRPLHVMPYMLPQNSVEPISNAGPLRSLRSNWRCWSPISMKQDG